MAEQQRHEQPPTPAERAAYFKEHPEEIDPNALRELPTKDREKLIGRLLNNFYELCPGGIDRKVRLDRRPEGRKPKPAAMSEKRYRETNGQFFAAIDAAIARCGLSLDEITEINQRIALLTEQLNKTLEPPKARAAIYAKLVPLRQNLEEKLLAVYKELRREYTDHDLTA